MGSNNLSKISAEELMADPKKYGFPTFDEFAKNPDKYRRSVDEVLAAASNGSLTIRNFVRRHIYEIAGYRAHSLEEVESIAKNEGLEIQNLEMQPQVIPIGAGKCDILVRFRKRTPQGEKKLREPKF